MIVRRRHYIYNVIHIVAATAAAAATRFSLFSCIRFPSLIYLEKKKKNKTYYVPI